MYRELLIQLKWLQNLGEIRQGDFNPFGPKEPTPGRRKRKPPRFEFLGAIGLLLGIFGLLGFLILRLVLSGIPMLTVKHGCLDCSDYLY